jgi:protoheme IX farnesyltransferase
MKKNRPNSLLSAAIELSKIKVMLPVSFTGFTGYFIYNPHITAELILVTAGILLMAISASVLNQIQEIETDGKMARTSNRPLPSGRISAADALIYFAISFVAGAALILFNGGKSAMVIGFLTLAWYNGVYTSLKRKTPFAVIPGAITGALPPLIGWVAAGGSPGDKTILLLEILLFTGQIPHFWLFALKYRDEYRQAGFPVLDSVMSLRRIKELISLEVIISSLIAILLYFFGVIRNIHIFAILVTDTIVLVWQFVRLSTVKGKNNLNRYSLILNTYFFLIMILLISDRIN